MKSRAHRTMRKDDERASPGSLINTAGLISEVCVDIRLGLKDDSDDGDTLIQDAVNRLEAHAKTLRMLAK